MEYKLVVFDMAGTTVEDTDTVAEFLKRAVRACGVAVSLSAVNAVMGMPKPLAIRTLLAKHGHPADEPTVVRTHAAFRDAMVRFYEDDPRVVEVAGASATFAWLRERGVRVALDTGFSRPIANAIVARLGWASRVDAVVTSDEVARGRPHPDMIFEAMRRTGVKVAARVVKVGDTPSDLAEGMAAGAGLVVGVCEGSHSRRALSRCPHHTLIGTVAELPACLMANGRYVRLAASLRTARA